MVALHVHWQPCLLQWSNEFKVFTSGKATVPVRVLREAGWSYTCKSKRRHPNDPDSCVRPVTIILRIPSTLTYTVKLAQGNSQNATKRHWYVSSTIHDDKGIRSRPMDL